MALIPITILILAYCLGANGDCTIDLDERTGKYPPFLLDSQSNILRPNGSRILKIDDGDDILLHCHEETIKSSTVPVSTSKKHFIRVKCQQTKFYYMEKEISPENVYCNRRIDPLLTKTKKVCSPIGSDGRKTGLETLYEIQVGFNFTGHYEMQIMICHDEKEYATIWTHHSILGNSIEYQDKSPSRPGFRVDIGRKRQFYFTSSTRMNRQYSKRNQVKSVKKLLGTDYITVEGKKVKIIDSRSSSSSYFAKGHLSPDAAFIYDVEQDATYFFFNVAPQFQAFNNRNWKALENICRSYASSKGYNIAVYTGTFGHLAYPNTQQVLTDIFIFPKEHYVPAPKYYWKVIHDEVMNEAIAYVGLNDIHARSSPPLLCTNRCNETTLKNPDFDHFDEGYTYCCEVEDLRRNLASVPNLVDSKGEYPKFLTGDKE